MSQKTISPKHVSSCLRGCPASSHDCIQLLDTARALDRFGVNLIDRIFRIVRAIEGPLKDEENNKKDGPKKTTTIRSIQRARVRFSNVLSVTHSARNLSIMEHRTYDRLIHAKHAHGASDRATMCV